VASDLKIKNKISIALPYFFLCLFMGFLQISGQIFFIISLKCCCCYCLHYSIIFYLVFHITVVFKGSSVCLLTRLQAELRMQFHSWQGQEIFLFSKMPRLTQSIPPTPTQQTPGIFPGVIEAKAQPDHSPAANVDIKNEQSYNSTAPICDHGVNRGNFISST